MTTSLQKRATKWALDCFGPAIVYNKLERCFRFIEEAVELVQAIGMSKDDVLKVVDYVYDRPPGKVEQEVGGVEITLAVLCETCEVDLTLAAENEYQRILIKADEIRDKNLNKEHVGYIQDQL